MPEQELILERSGGVGVLTLNRPERLNALPRRLTREELPRIFQEIKDDDAIKALIITGAGDGFCAGPDVSGMDKGPWPEDASDAEKLAVLNETMTRFLRPLVDMGKPTIAAVNGVAAGMGVSLALFCDLRFASEKARFALSFVRRGLTPDMGATFALPRLIGVSRALEYMLTGDFISAEEASRIGLVNKVVPHAQLMQTTLGFAERLAKSPSVSVSLIKKMAYKSLSNTLDEQLELESSSQLICFETEDFREGVKSFLEKRPAVFKGR